MPLKPCEDWCTRADGEGRHDGPCTHPDDDVRPMSVPDIIVMAEHTCEDLEAMREDIAVLRHSTVESATALELYGIGDDLMQAWAKVQQVRTALEAYGAIHG